MTSYCRMILPFLLVFDVRSLDGAASFLEVAAAAALEGAASFLEGVAAAAAEGALRRRVREQFAESVTPCARA